MLDLFQLMLFLADLMALMLLVRWLQWFRRVHFVTVHDAATTFAKHRTLKQHLFVVPFFPSRIFSICIYRIVFVFDLTDEIPGPIS